MSGICFKIILIDVNPQQPDWETRGTAGAGRTERSLGSYKRVDCGECVGGRDAAGKPEGKTVIDIFRGIESPNTHLRTLTTDPEEKLIESGMGTFYKEGSWEQLLAKLQAHYLLPFKIHYSENPSVIDNTRYNAALNLSSILNW